MINLHIFVNLKHSPRWCMSSQEVGSGIAFLIALCLAGFILLPAFLLGVHIGAKDY